MSKIEKEAAWCSNRPGGDDRRGQQGGKLYFLGYVNPGGTTCECCVYSHKPHGHGGDVTTDTFPLESGGPVRGRRNEFFRCREFDSLRGLCQR